MSSASRACKDAPGRGSPSAQEPISTIRPPYITAMRSATSTATPMSCVTKITPSPSSRCNSRISSSTWICTVASSAVVGSSASSTLGRQASASAIMARWRMPPDISCGIVVEPALGRGDAHPLEQCQGPLAAFGDRHAIVLLDRFGDLVADAIDRVEREAGVLEDHRRRCGRDRRSARRPTSPARRGRRP